MRVSWAACLAFCGMMSAVQVSAAEVEWKFYTYFAANDKPTQLHKAFAAAVDKNSGGRFKITVFASGELPYKAADVLRVVAQDQVQIGDVGIGSVAGDVPELNALALPFSCVSMDKFYDKVAPAIAADVDATLVRKFKVHSILQWTMPPQQLWLTKEVSGLDGFKNLKVRSWNREQSEMMRLLGGSGISITTAEVIPALQRHVVDGAFTAAVPAMDWKIWEVARYAFMMNLTLSHQVIVVNQAEMDKLPADLRAVLLDTARSFASEYRSTLIAADKEARRVLVEKGITLHDATAAETARLREVVKPIWADWIAKTGPSGEAMLRTAETDCQ